jgi:Integrase core domain
MSPHRPRQTIAQSAFAGFCFPSDVIVLAVRWYLRYGLSYRDVEELLAERGIEVDHVTIYRWVLRFTPLLAEAAWPCRHAVGDRWQVDETSAVVSDPRRGCEVHRAFDHAFRSEGCDVLITPVQAPNANAHAQRWIRTVRAACLDWLLLPGHRHLEQVLGVYVDHSNVHRRHRALGWNRRINPPVQPPSATIKGACIAATALAGCSASTTGELHERVSAPYGTCGRR